MADKTMRIRFKTKVRDGGVTEPAGKIHVLPEEQAKAYIERNLAVEVKGDDAAERGAKEAAAKAKAEAEKAAK